MSEFWGNRKSSNYKELVPDPVNQFSNIRLQHECKDEFPALTFGKIPWKHSAIRDEHRIRFCQSIVTMKTRYPTMLTAAGLYKEAVMMQVSHIKQQRYSSPLE